MTKCPLRMSRRLTLSSKIAMRFASGSKKLLFRVSFTFGTESNFNRVSTKSL